MKPCLLLVFLLSLIFHRVERAVGQHSLINLQNELISAKHDTTKSRILTDISGQHAGRSPREGVKYGLEALAIAQKLGNQSLIVAAYKMLGLNYSILGDEKNMLEAHDYLITYYKDQNDKLSEARANHDMAILYRHKGNLEKVVSYSKKARELFEAAGNNEGVVDALCFEASALDIKGEFKSAEDNLDAAMTVAVKARDQSLIAFVAESRGTMLLRKDNYPEALKHSLIALKSYERIGDPKQIQALNAIIAKIHRQAKEYDLAIGYYRKAEQIAETMQDTLLHVVSLANIGTTYFEAGNHQEALPSLLEAYDIIKVSAIKSLHATISNNLAKVYTKTREYKKSEQFINESLALTKAPGARRLQGGITLSSRGELYLAMARDTTFGSDQRNQFANRSVASLDSALAVFAGLNEVNYRMANEGLRSEALAILGSYAESLKSYRRHIQLKDSLFSEKNVKDMVRLEQSHLYEKKQDSLKFANDQKQLQHQKEMQLTTLRHEFERKQASAKSEEERLILLQKEELKRQKIENEYALAETESKRKEAEARLALERERMIRNFSLAGLLLISCIGGLLYYQGLQRKRHNLSLIKLNEELEESNRIKARFFGILNHDLRSPVSNLIHFLHLKNEEPEFIDEPARIRLEKKTTQGAENLLSTMEDLLLWSKGQMQNFKPHLQPILVKTLFDDIQLHFAGEERISFRFEVPDNLVVKTDEDYLKTIVRNLTANAIKVLNGTDAATISWRALQINNHVQLAVTDNGSGANMKQFRALYDEKEVVGIKSGLGLHLVRDLAKAIHCTVTVDSEVGEGTTVTLHL